MAVQHYLSRHNIIATYGCSSRADLVGFVVEKVKLWQAISISPSSNYFTVETVAARSEARALIARALDRRFESPLRHECLSSSFCVALCK
jgi:hypothetical protein